MPHSASRCRRPFETHIIIGVSENPGYPNSSMVHHAKSGVHGGTNISGHLHIARSDCQVSRCIFLQEGHGRAWSSIHLFHFHSDIPRAHCFDFLIIRTGISINYSLWMSMIYIYIYYIYIYSRILGTFLEWPRSPWPSQVELDRGTSAVRPGEEEVPAKKRGDELFFTRSATAAAWTQEVYDTLGPVVRLLSQVYWLNVLSPKVQRHIFQLKVLSPRTFSGCRLEVREPWTTTSYVVVWGQHWSTSAWEFWWETPRNWCCTSGYKRTSWAWGQCCTMLWDQRAERLGNQLGGPSTKMGWWSHKGLFFGGLETANEDLSI